MKMKKYLILSFLFLLTINPIFAKGPSDDSASNQQSGQPNNQINPQANDKNKLTITPTGNQVKNTNQIQTQNQGQEQQIEVKNQKDEKLNEMIQGSFTKVSDQVHGIINTSGVNGGIGDQVREIAQNQTKLQQEIKETFDNINSQGTLRKFLFGSDKQLIKTMEQKMEENRLMIEKLEQLKSTVKNASDLENLQITINTLTNQSTSLQEKISRENRIKGVFSWLTSLINQ